MSSAQRSVKHGSDRDVGPQEAVFARRRRGIREWVESKRRNPSCADVRTIVDRTGLVGKGDRNKCVGRREIRTGEAHDDRNDTTIGCRTAILHPMLPSWKAAGLRGVKYAAEIVKFQAACDERRGARVADFRIGAARIGEQSKEDKNAHSLLYGAGCSSSDEQETRAGQTRPGAGGHRGRPPRTWRRRTSARRAWRPGPVRPGSSLVGDGHILRKT